MKKFFILMFLTIVSTQIVVAESYQRWIYWISPVNHEVTASEMAEISSLLYDNKVVANKDFSLSTGVRLKIPQPSLYLKYIEKAVKSANPAVLTKDDVIFCLNDSEKMRWGNDISGQFKNYYFSYVYKDVKFINNFNGEGKDVDFLFINGIPSIKCDCGNPIENQNPQQVKKASLVDSSDSIITNESQKSNENHVVIIRTIYGGDVNYRQPVTPRTQVQARNPWIPVITVGGITVVAGLGYLVYSILNRRPTEIPGNPGGAPTTTPSGGPGGTPPGGGGPGGAPL